MRWRTFINMLRVRIFLLVGLLWVRMVFVKLINQVKGVFIYVLRQRLRHFVVANNKLSLQKFLIKLLNHVSLRQWRTFDWRRRLMELQKYEMRVDVMVLESSLN
ncbi:hypothetical protein D3C77_590010 [compost metagenome]